LMSLTKKVRTSWQVLWLSQSVFHRCLLSCGGVAVSAHLCIDVQISIRLAFKA